MTPNVISAAAHAHAAVSWIVWIAIGAGVVLLYRWWSHNPVAQARWKASQARRQHASTAARFFAVPSATLA